MDNCIWRAKEAPRQSVELLARELRLPDWAARVLALRGITDPDLARAYLHPAMDQLPNPRGLKGLDAALRVLLPAIREGRTVGVAGDYDADGVTSSALLVDFLERLGVPVVWELPHRMIDGYGFGPATARRLKEKGAQAVVTVDCGISDHEGLAAARDLGLEVVVTDHHQTPPGPPPPALAVINPQQEGCTFPPQLAGVGLAFYLAAGIRSALDEEGFFADRPKPNLRDSLDLVALGTCADVVPLTGCNRVLVREGLLVLNQRRRPGLEALARAAGGAGRLDSRDLGFALAPRINAPGRLEHAGPALELLLCQDPGEARRLAGELDRLNSRRKDMEQEILRQALEKIQGDPSLGQADCLVLGDKTWHRGVLGIVASRLVDRLGRPVLLFALENGTAHGSGRSVEGFHLQRALTEAAPLLLGYGGHARAAGATLAAKDVPRLARALDQAARKALPSPGGPRVLELEAEVELSEMGPEAMRVLEDLAPFGHEAPEPLLGLKGAVVSRAREVGDGHLKLELEQNGRRAGAIGFNMAQRAPRPGQRVDLAFSPRISNFRGRHLELALEDIRPAA